MRTCFDALIHFIETHRPNTASLWSVATQVWDRFIDTMQAYSSAGFGLSLRSGQDTKQLHAQDIAAVYMLFPGLQGRIADAGAVHKWLMLHISQTLCLAYMASAISGVPVTLPSILAIVTERRVSLTPEWTEPLSNVFNNLITVKNSLGPLAVETFSLAMVLGIELPLPNLDGALTDIIYRTGMVDDEEIETVSQIGSKIASILSTKGTRLFPMGPVLDKDLRLWYTKPQVGRKPGADINCAWPVAVAWIAMLEAELADAPGPSIILDTEEEMARQVGMGLVDYVDVAMTALPPVTDEAFDALDCGAAGPAPQLIFAAEALSPDMRAATALSVLAQRHGCSLEDVAASVDRALKVLKPGKRRAKR
ncbi:hypothetical protein J8273_3454 [Carpediemonas membranifera]|uniref:Uncharacterized protein n=1 Tax=Carpediemonas membranifera TaxID=201153 RepID=A0A8J6AV65_9EUKA|nr:hypothetical protein J8273_3454 [Carpediemonas membranifera]|eukprot:KAG9393320.1 hypothetical protein J8273_3454 [Carpediemonas membranifera]